MNYAMEAGVELLRVLDEKERCLGVEILATNLHGTQLGRCHIRGDLVPGAAIRVFQGQVTKKKNVTRAPVPTDELRRFAFADEVVAALCERTLLGKSAVFVKLQAHNALALLVFNVLNRALRQNGMTMYAEDMLAGDFVTTADGIGFDTGLTIVNGQNRLWALLLASMYAAGAGRENPEIEVVLVGGLDPKSRFYTDRGRKREGHETISMEDTANGAPLGQRLNAAGLSDSSLKKALIVAGYLVRWERNSLARPNHRPPSDTAKKHYLDHNLEAIAEAMVATRDHRLILAANLAATIYFIFNQVDVEMTRSLFDGLRDPSKLKLGDPVIVLRRFLEEKMTMAVTMYHFIRAWNARVAGELCYNKWMLPKESRPIDFPGILDPKEAGVKPSPVVRRRAPTMPQIAKRLRCSALVASILRQPCLDAEARRDDVVGSQFHSTSETRCAVSGAEIEEAGYDVAGLYNEVQAAAELVVSKDVDYEWASVRLDEHSDGSGVAFIIVFGMANQVDSEDVDDLQGDAPDTVRSGVHA